MRKSRGAPSVRHCLQVPQGGVTVRRGGVQVDSTGEAGTELVIVVEVEALVGQEVKWTYGELLQSRQGRHAGAVVQDDHGELAPCAACRRQHIGQPGAIGQGPEAGSRRRLGRTHFPRWAIPHEELGDGHVGQRSTGQPPANLPAQRAAAITPHRATRESQQRDRNQPERDQRQQRQRKEAKPEPGEGDEHRQRYHTGGRQCGQASQMSPHRRHLTRHCPARLTDRPQPFPVRIHSPRRAPVRVHQHHHQRVQHVSRVGVAAAGDAPGIEGLVHPDDVTAEQTVTRRKLPGGGDARQARGDIAPGIKGDDHQRDVGAPSLAPRAQHVAHQRGTHGLAVREREGHQHRFPRQLRQVERLAVLVGERERGHVDHGRLQRPRRIQRERPGLAAARRTSDITSSRPRPRLRWPQYDPSPRAGRECAQVAPDRIAPHHEQHRQRPQGSPTSSTQPPALGRPPGMAPKQTSRVRATHSGVAAPAGYSASAHQATVTRTMTPSAASATPRYARAIPATPRARAC